jgi:hypothetical protein
MNEVARTLNSSYNNANSGIPTYKLSTSLNPVCQAALKGIIVINTTFKLKKT